MGGRSAPVPQGKSRLESEFVTDAKVCRALISGCCFFSFFVVYDEQPPPSPPAVGPK